MLFLMEVRKFYQRERGGSKAPPIGLKNGVNFRFFRYLHDPVTTAVVNLSFHSTLSIFKLIFLLCTIWSKIAANA